MSIITIHNKKVYEKLELDEFNNLADKPTGFINFISFLCKKYKLNVSKLATCNSYERNLGVELNGDKVLVQFFYEYDINTLELVVSVNGNNTLEHDIKNNILRYIKTVNYKKGDKVVDTYGEEYLVQEDITPSNTLKRHKSIRISDNKDCDVYNHFILPYLD